MSNLSKAAQLRAAYTSAPIMVPGVFNALAARMAERVGFQAIYLSGAALSAGLAAVPDVGLLTADEFATAARYLASAVTIPLIADADTGFGEPLNVERTVRLYESAGVAGLHLEDQEFPKRCGHLSGKQVVPAEAMVAKLRAAASARRDPDFVIIARTDARGVSGFDDAVRRAELYLEAGADMIFPEALESKDELARFAREVRAPLVANLTEFGKTPPFSFAELATIGYSIILYPLTVFRVAMRAAEDALRELKTAGTQAGLLSKMQTRQELYDLLGYRDYESRDRAYFGGTHEP